MSSLVRCCLAITSLTVSACGPRASESPRHPSAEARNAETEKKPRKQRQPVIAPPPAYGNKIVQVPASRGELANASRFDRF